MTANAAVPPFLLDTNILIDIGERLYPPDIFPALWQQLETVLTSGEVVVGKLVLGEIRRVQNPQQWRHAVTTFCTPHAIDESRATVQAVFARLSGDAAAGRLSKKLSDNDLLLLSCAEVDRVPIVTNDRRMQLACQKGIARARNIGLIDIFRHFGWQF